MRTYGSLDLSSANIKSLFTLTRLDEIVTRFTNASTPITIGSETWVPVAGLQTFDVADYGDGTTSSTQLKISCDDGGPVTAQDVADKCFEEARLEWDICNADTQDAKYFHFYGRVGGVSKPARSQVLFDLQNPHGFPISNLVPTITVACRFAFGDPFCGVPIMRPAIERATFYVVGDTRRHATAGDYGNRYFEVTAISTGQTGMSAPSFNYTIGATTTDGGVTWTARNSYERTCEIATVPNRHNLTLVSSVDARDVDGWFAPGKIRFTSGINKNRIFPIGSWIKSSLALTTFLPAGFLTEPGDTALIWPDCDKTVSMCRDKYANGIRHGGFAFYAGAKAAKLDGS